MLYVRKGLGRPEIILPVVRFAFEVQQELRKPWALVPVSHGWGDELKHLGTDLPMRYINESSRAESIAQEICRMAGQELDPGPVTVRQLFPRTDVRSLYGGKVNVTPDDLLVFVEPEGELLFDCRLRWVLGDRMQRQVVVAEAPPSTDRLNWSFAGNRIEFTEPENA
jgi:hypothetical protein